VDLTTAVLVVTATIFVWGLVSARLERSDVTAPIVFVAIGSIIAVLGLVDPFTAPERLKPLVELTLVWVLFCDAARVPVSDLRRDMGRYARLLGIGLPLSVVLGFVLAIWLLPGLDVWLALLVAAALAPTDAALGVPVVTNRAVPARVRRLITVESGLNDGIVTPLVVAAIAGAASAEGLTGAGGVGTAAAELALGVVVGVALGFGGGALLRWARRRGWSAEEFAGIAVLALAVGCYLGAIAVGGNGFVAAFCGGLGFGAAAGRRERAETAFLEQVSGLVSLLVWMAFGFIAVPIVRGGLDLVVVVYAVLSLTLVRMLPVALALIGSHLDRWTVLFVGWFGPRGLASLVFALLALEELGPRADPAVLAIGVTVLLSVLAHGLSAEPLAVRYGNAVSTPVTEPRDAIPDLPVRGLPRRRGTDEISETDPTTPPPSG
jgi:sodium/hydrogen antiporter